MEALVISPVEKILSKVKELTPAAQRSAADFVEFLWLREKVVEPNGESTDKRSAISPEETERLKKLSLLEMMDFMSQKAEERGLTPEILAEILNEND